MVYRQKNAPSDPRSGKMQNAAFDAEQLFYINKRQRKSRQLRAFLICRRSQFPCHVDSELRRLESRCGPMPIAILSRRKGLASMNTSDKLVDYWAHALERVGLASLIFVHIVVCCISLVYAT